MDHNSYPAYVVGGPHSAFHLAQTWLPEFDEVPTFAMSDDRALHSLTTPVSYVTTYLSVRVKPNLHIPHAYYSTGGKPEEKAGWVLWTLGPDSVYDINYAIIKKIYDPSIPQPSPLFAPYLYDATNGTNSRGDIVRVMEFRKP